VPAIGESVFCGGAHESRADTAAAMLWSDVNVGYAVNARAVPREANLADDGVGACQLGNDRERARPVDGRVHG